MASGDVVMIVHQVQPPATSFAVLTMRAGGSTTTPSERIPVWAFDAASDEYLDFYCQLVGYGGGGLTFRIGSMAATATTGGALIALAIRALPDDTVDVDTAYDYVPNFNEVRIPAASASGELTYDTITFTNGADMDNLATGQAFILRMRRRGSDNTATTGDDMAGDWQLFGIYCTET
jgi:hypothetical protein